MIMLVMKVLKPKLYKLILIKLKNKPAVVRDAVVVIIQTVAIPVAALVVVKNHVKVGVD